MSRLMAGSYNHCVDTATGKLYDAEGVCNMLECRSGDVYEAVEEMFGMIWFLAGGDPAKVETARQSYQEGLALSPGIDFELPDDDE